MEARRFCFLYNFCHHAGQRARRIPVYLHRRRTAHACSSTIPIPTFAKKHCSKSCSRRSSWRTTMAGRSTRTTCARAPCWKTRSCCARRLRRSAVFLFINVLRHFTAQRASFTNPQGIYLAEKRTLQNAKSFQSVEKVCNKCRLFRQTEICIVSNSFCEGILKIIFEQKFPATKTYLSSRARRYPYLIFAEDDEL